MKPKTFSSFLVLSMGLLLFWGSPVFAKTPWEVAIVFLNADDDEEYQKDIDRNLMEIARLQANEMLRLSLLRELPARTVTYFPDPKSEELNPLQNLLFGPIQKSDIAGPMTVVPREAGAPSVISRGPELQSFLQKAFSLPRANRLLILYGHGLGYEGLKTVGLKRLRERLEESIPRREGKPLDLLWLDSCFMASVEVAVELRSLTQELIASEEAEFSAGAPFDVLQGLLGHAPDEIEGISEGFAERFLESYSFIERGSQTDAIVKSSATISVVDVERLEKVTSSLKEVSSDLAQLSGDWKARVAKRLPKIQMDKPELVDLGSLALTFKDLRLLSSEALNTLLKTLEVNKKGKLKTNPRLKVLAPFPGSLLVYGYEGWKRGYEGDEEILEKLPENLEPAGFLNGPKGKKWPQREVNIHLYLTPFTVGINQFDFYFAHPETGKALTPTIGVDRSADYVTFTAGHDENPLLFTGYTQGIGKKAERYSGLNISQPLQGVPSVDYLDLDFYQATQWSNF